MSRNREVLKDVGRMNLHIKLRVIPHHVLRENKQATGAGADRVSEGMRLAFGKAVGTAARVMKDQAVFTTYTTPQYLDKVKLAMKAGSHKLPSPSYFTVVDRSSSAPSEIPSQAVNQPE